MEGRNLLQSVMVTNEVVEEAKRGRNKCLVFKVDYEKTHDLVSWEFLLYMLKRMGNGTKWIGWIK